MAALDPALCASGMQGTNAHMVATSCPNASLAGAQRKPARTCWEHQSLWVLCRPHLLLASVTSTAGIASFQSNLTTTRLAFLKEHCVTGSPIFPGSGYFEAGAAAVATLHQQRQQHRSISKGPASSGLMGVLSDTTIPAPLQLENLGAHYLVLQTSVQLTSGVVEMTSSRMRGRRLHAKGNAVIPAVTGAVHRGTGTARHSMLSSTLSVMRGLFGVSAENLVQPSAAVGSVVEPTGLTHPASDGFRCHPAMGDNVLQLGQTLIAPSLAINLEQQPSGGVFVPAALGCFLIRGTANASDAWNADGQQGIWAAIGPVADAMRNRLTHSAWLDQVTSNAQASGDGLSGSFCVALRLTCKRMNLQPSHEIAEKPAIHMATSMDEMTERPALAAPNVDCCYQMTWQAAHPKPITLIEKKQQPSHPYGSHGMKLLGSRDGTVQVASLLALVQGTLQLPQGPSVPQQGSRAAALGDSTMPGILIRGHLSTQNGCSPSAVQSVAHHNNPASLHALLKAAALESALLASCTLADPNSPHSDAHGPGHAAVSVFKEGKWVPGDLHGSHTAANTAIRPLLVRCQPSNPTEDGHRSLSAEGRFQLVPDPRGRLNSLKPVALETNPESLGEHEVLVAVGAVGLNFRDVLNVLGLYPGDAGMPGSDVAGRIAAGRVRDSQGHVLAGPGDAVLGLTAGALASHVVCSAQTLVRFPSSSLYCTLILVGRECHPHRISVRRAALSVSSLMSATSAWLGNVV